MKWEETMSELNKDMWMRIRRALPLEMITQSLGEDLRTAEAGWWLTLIENERLMRHNEMLGHFSHAIEHVTENGKTRRSVSDSRGWAVLHIGRLTDLEIAEERLDAAEAECARLRERVEVLEVLLDWARGSIGRHYEDECDWHGEVDAVMAEHDAALHKDADRG